MAAATPDPTATEKAAASDPPTVEELVRYSVFTRAEKRCIVSMAAWASWTSNLSVFIYLPALKPLSEAFGVSVGQINLTLTVYMAIAAVAPIVIGDVADVLGRRLAYFFTLTLFFFACVGVALSSSYGQLLGLRALQALGQSSIIIIGYGVVGDVASPAERGAFMSFISFTITVGPSVGPVLGGALCYAAGWQWIFWFLAINGGICLASMFFFFPETSRTIVGNGSLSPPRLLRLPISIASYCRHWEADSGAHVVERLQVPNPLRSLRILLRKDNAVVVLSLGFMYTVYSCLTATTSTLFIELYDLNEVETGVSYLPFALGGTLSTFCSGWVLDNTYQRARGKLGLSTDKIHGDDLDTFPIEKTRVQVIWLPMLIISISTIAYGWVLHARVHIAVSLVLQFIIGFALQFNFSSYNTLLVDINHRSPSSANASTSIIRSAFAAIAVAFIEDLFHAVGVGFAFTLVGGLCVISLALLFVEYHKGFSWRTKD